MSLTIHDLRVSLRDKMKKIEDLEAAMSDLKTELSEKNKTLKENEATLRKKDDIISMKDLIIKEKDSYILKLEADLQMLGQQLKTGNNKENGMDVTENCMGKVNRQNNYNSKLAGKVSIGSNSSPWNSSMNNGGGALLNSTNLLNPADLYAKKQPAQQQPKSKRIAISAEPAQIRLSKTNDSKTYLQKFDKSKA